MKLAAFCALNGLGSLVPMLYEGDALDQVWVEAVAEQVDRMQER